MDASNGEKLILTLLRSKNRCLERFIAISNEFLAQAGRGEFGDLEGFELRRESTLKAIELYDRKISEAVLQLAEGRRTQSLVEAVKDALDRKDALVHEILDIDMRIISLIEQEKNRLLQELSSARRGKDLLGKFKSGWVAESGEELDAKL
jgi:hypothetical protein